jgi:hypothetical protein
MVFIKKIRDSVLYFTQGPQIFGDGLKLIQVVVAFRIYNTVLLQLFTSLGDP